MDVKVSVDTKRIRLRFDRLAPDMLGRLSASAQVLDDELVARAQGLASGAVLQVKSGKYVSHIKGRVSTTRNGVYARASVAGIQAHLFEYGGKTPPHDIEPDSAKALVLQVAGGKVFASKVHHPGGDFGRTNFGAGSQGKYSVLQVAYGQMRAEIFTRLYDAASAGVADGE